MTLQTATSKNIQNSEIVKLDISSQWQDLNYLWNLTFNFWEGSQNTKQYLETEPVTVFGIYDQNRLMASACYFDFTTRLNQQWIPCAGIAGVACEPEARRQGLVKALVRHCLEDINKRDIPVAALWPFNHSFYENCGFALTDLHYFVQIPIHELKRFSGANKYKQIKLDKENPDTIFGAKKIHDQWIENFNLSFKRSDYRWRRLLFSPWVETRMFLHDAGYMAWDFKQSQEKNLTVLSWVYQNQEAFENGLALLGQMDSQFETITFRSHEIDSLIQSGINLHDIKITTSPKCMARVVNRKSFENLFIENKTAYNTLSELDIFDPMGITANIKSSNNHRTHSRLDSGQVIQLVTGFFKQEPKHFPKELSALAGKLPIFCAESY